MKKFLLVLTSILLVIFTGCSSNAEDASKTAETTTTSTADTVITPEDIGVDDVDVDNISSEEELKAKYLELYSEKAADDKFITDSEALTYEAYGFSVKNEKYGWIASYDELWHEEQDYYKPVFLTENIIVYICDDGHLGFFDLNGEQKKTWINIHGNFSDENIIGETADYAILYSDSRVSLWKFGEKISEFDLPEGAVYAGKSRWVGYIFRAGSNVYSVTVEDTGDLTSTPIAHGVKQVICAEYKLDSDAWSQPLFQMQDGSIKAYCRWNNEQDEEKKDDDPSFLHQINESWFEK